MCKGTKYSAREWKEYVKNHNYDVILTETTHPDSPCGVKNPRYIFLDEATNALDAENERVIVENLNDFYQGRTVVVVAHRLSTVKNTDQIIVLGHGKILETGNHASLIEKKGAYYHLVKNQLELGN